ncbi:hypothetical protein MHZ95_20170 [Sporosarcina sp. ACRSM]|uniref:hypothetical protein n=1 Tax=Sporosarcina sp. ACRSM TaxID=2918216 RepID=UPI001EF743E9|nr:hypothetical protein [Sporosarcina sp. ACRSM]MCG7337561.1 hypothetical protein [Sporosarcina sp. ACRSM]
MKKERSEKKLWWLFFLTFGFFSAIWFFIFYFINKQINYTKDAVYFGTPLSAYWAFFLSAIIYGLATWGIYFCIKEGIREKSFKVFRSGVGLVQRLARIPILLTLPFLYLGVTNALVIAEEKIIFSTFWNLKQDEYDWTDGVKNVEIDYSIPIESDSNRRSFNGKYILHFSDGKQIDLWANTFEGGIDTVQEIDSFIQTKNIPFYVRHAPTEDTINKFFTINADFIRELYSR